MKSILGIDTSAYTTSLALVSEAGEVKADVRQVLKVEAGKRGLRQSEALFRHIRNLPFLFTQVEDKLVAQPLGAVAVSIRPRNVAGSYMPVFVAGESIARSLASATGVPLFMFSHQEGHIMAAAAEFSSVLPEIYMAVHFSGGTSEVLMVRPGNEFYYNITVLAATTDLHAGQLVDRVGVKMGLPFPSGKYLEEMARAAVPAGRKNLSIPAAVNEDRFSFSGAESLALRFLEEGVPKEEVAFAVLRCISNTLEKVIKNQVRLHGVRHVLLAGGVMANSLIRERLRERLSHPAVGLNLFFAPPGLSTDNAVGTALLGRMKWLKIKA